LSLGFGSFGIGVEQQVCCFADFHGKELRAWRLECDQCTQLEVLGLVAALLGFMDRLTHTVDGKLGVTWALAATAPARTALLTYFASWFILKFVCVLNTI